MNEKRRKTSYEYEIEEYTSEEICKKFKRLVCKIAHRFTNPGNFAIEDLIQEGFCGLLIAHKRFDWRKGKNFPKYATYWIRLAIQRGIQNTGFTIRTPVWTTSSKIKELTRILRSENTYVHNTHIKCQGILDTTQRSKMNAVEDKIDVEFVLRKVPEDKLPYLVRYYGLLGFAKENQREIGESVGLSSTAIHQKLSNTIRLLKKEVAV